jgi:hypothetical protein
MAGEVQVFSWKNPQGDEVDFVVKEGTRVARLIQVCVEPRAGATHDREVRGLLKASSDLRCKDLVVLTDADEREEKASWFGLKGTIRYIPLWKWFLGEQK